MRLLNKKDFLKLPNGTMYLEKVSDNACYFGNLCVKDESISDIDFYSIDLNNPDLSPIRNEQYYESFERLDKGEALKVDFNYGGRDGMYDDNDMYYVLEKDDVKSLLDVITEAYKSYK